MAPIVGILLMGGFVLARKALEQKIENDTCTKCPHCRETTVRWPVNLRPTVRKPEIQNHGVCTNCRRTWPSLEAYARYCAEHRY